MLVASVDDDGAVRDDIRFPWRRDLSSRQSEPPRAIRRRALKRPTRTSVVGRILDAATEAVAYCGIDGLSMEDVAERAGCSRATVYRRIGGKEALRDAVLDEAIDRINATVAQTVDQLHGDERVITAIVTSLGTIRADPVSAALLVGPPAAESASGELITQVIGSIAVLTGLDEGDGVGCELIARVTLALLCWPPADRSRELDIVSRLVRASFSDDRRPATQPPMSVNGQVPQPH